MPTFKALVHFIQICTHAEAIFERSVGSFSYSLHKSVNDGIRINDEFFCVCCMRNI